MELNFETLSPIQSNDHFDVNASSNTLKPEDRSVVALNQLWNDIDQAFNELDQLFASPTYDAPPLFKDSTPEVKNEALDSLNMPEKKQIEAFEKEIADAGNKIQSLETQLKQITDPQKHYVAQGALDIIQLNFADAKERLARAKTAFEAFGQAVLDKADELLQQFNELLQKESPTQDDMNKLEQLFKSLEEPTLVEASLMRALYTTGAAIDLLKISMDNSKNLFVAA